MKRIISGLAGSLVFSLGALLVVYFMFAGEMAVSSKRKNVKSDDICLTDKSVISELEKRRTSLEEKKKKLDEKEAELGAREQAIGEKIVRLEEIRKEIQVLQGLGDEKSEENISKFVETLEKMSPKASAKLLAKVNDSLAVTAMKRVESTRLAKILNLMEPARSSRLSEMLASMSMASFEVRTTASNDVGTGTSKKGGDSDDGHNK